MALAALFLVFALLLVLGAPVAIALIISTISAALVVGIPPIVVGQQAAADISNVGLLAIPLFVFAGELMLKGGISERIIALASALVGRFRGGLAQVSVVASTLFGGVSGSAIADISAVGGTMIPQMAQRGYDKEYAVNVTISAALVALLVPPSHNMILFSAAAGGGISITALFSAGIIPALMLALAVMAMLLLVQALVALAVKEVTDDYVRRFMGGTVLMLQHELAPLQDSARAQRVRELDERFAYPVALAPAQGFTAEEQARLAAGELLVTGFNRRVVAALPPGPAQPTPGTGMASEQVLVLGPLDPDWNPEHRLNLPRELWLQMAAAMALACAVGLSAWALLRPAWRDLRALQRTADALGAGRFDTPMPALDSRLFAAVGRGMRATLERLAGALAAQRELTGAVSHELRTPLARLRFALDALVDEEDAARRAGAVAACERDIDELEALIDTSLTLARLDMGAVAAVPAPGDLTALLDQELQALAPLLEGKTVGTHWALPGTVDFDARLLPYALRNGVRNAVRHARARIELRAWVEGGRVFVAVDDDGPGVPPEQREAVFQPFKRLDGERERRSRGWGLGLAIVRRVAEAHGGQARMQSAPLGGARLLIDWPTP
jgi:two-component system sensor histidine kinase RstB